MNLSSLRQQWLPVCTAKQVTNKPKRWLLLDEPLVIYKVNEQVVALQDRCPHRGIPLSAGKLVGDTLQCAYHGWRFDSAGQCVLIPGLVKPVSMTDKCVRAYPIRIHYGLIFICLDEDETTRRLYDIPALTNPDYHFHLMPFKIHGDILDIIENTLDATHTHYVHAGLLRQDKHRQTITAKLTVSPVSAEVLYKEEHKPTGLISTLFERNRQGSIGRFHAPLIIELEYLGEKNIATAFSFFICPMSEKEHQVFLLISYKKKWFTSWLKKVFFYPFIQIAFKQDVRVLRLQELNKKSFANVEFKSTELDILRPHIERILQNNSKEYQKIITMRL